MAVRARKTPDALIHALVAAHNLRQTEAVASFFHADTTQLTSGYYDNPSVADDLVTAANGSSLATNIALLNDILAVLQRHFADTLAHNTAVTAALALDALESTAIEATTVTRANALKVAYGAHLSEANVHFTNDATNTVAAVDATNTATVSTLANEMKGDINTHIVSAPLGAMVKVVPA